ncbi:MAG: N-6 DNA methylase [Nannocystis sp.]|nr:DNA methyltransferase [Nannocystis sp.]MBA3547588.1 N-6 DNA methylase [Nannocystis sp.]
MTPEHKKILRALVLELRGELEGSEDSAGRWQPGDLERRLVELGVRRDRTPLRVDELPRHVDLKARQTFDAYLTLRLTVALDLKVAEEARRAAAKRGRAKPSEAAPKLSAAEQAEVLGETVAEFIRESAYTWANRLLALRCLEARGLIDEVILQKESYGGRSLAHWRLIQRNPDAGRDADEGLFATLFAAFELHAERLPRLFHPTAPGLALRPTLAALRRCLALLSGAEAPRSAEPADDAVFSAADALGWAYQFWNTDTKERVFTAVRTKKGTKIKGADIIPATQLYTEPYMVRFLVQNSLGATWAAMHPETALAEHWDYFVRDADRTPMTPKSATTLTVLDPACGSGHFLLAAQADLWDMYEEEGAFADDPVGRARAILEHNLYGLDIDERAVQIAEAALWMAAAEQIVEHGIDLHARGPDNRLPLCGLEMNLVATNIRLPGEGDQLVAFLKKYPDAAPLRPALAEVFRGLAHVDQLGSLVQIEGPVERVLHTLQAEHTRTRAYGGTQTDMLRAASAQGALPIGVESYEDWKQRTLRSLAAHFADEAVDADLGRRLYGQAARKAVAAFDLLARRYDVVVANPPYMGSKNMGDVVRPYVEKHYESGKRDLYAAFMLRCLELCNEAGRVGVVVPQPWMFFSSYEQLRYFTLQKLAEKAKKTGANLYRGLLALTTLETIAQLGRHAFEEADPPSNVALVVLSQHAPADEHTLTAFRLQTSRPSTEQASLLRAGVRDQRAAFRFKARQSDLRAIPMAPLAFWLRPSLLRLLAGTSLGDIARVAQGTATAEDGRFVRFVWETPRGTWTRARPQDGRWVPFEKGGGYAKWFGKQWWMVDWHHNGARLLAFPGSVIRNPDFYFKPGWTYSLMARGSMGLRVQDQPAVFGHMGPKVVLPHDGLAVICNSRAFSYFVRTSSPSLKFEVDSVSRGPVPKTVPIRTTDALVQSKRALISRDPTERAFRPDDEAAPTLRTWACDTLLRIFAESAVLHTLEGQSESDAFAAYGLDDADTATILADVGTPTGWFDLVDGHTDHDALPWPADCAAPTLPATRSPQPAPAPLRAALEAGPGGTDDDDDAEEDEADEGLTGQPIPTETFLEALAQRFNVHPISLHSLLRAGIETQGWRCPPEEQRLVRDRLTVLTLHLVGHQWPQQVAAREALPEWADADGIIPVTEGAHESTLLARMRGRLIVEFPNTPLSATERDIAELAGLSLEAWTDGGFFRHHITQFRRRPIAWQLQSTAPSKGNRLAFACLLHFHALDADCLPKLRTQYIRPQRTRAETELRGLEAIPTDRYTDIQKTRVGTLEEQIKALRQLDDDLGKVIERGFFTPELADHAIDDAAESHLAQLLDALARRLDATLPAEALKAAAATYLRAVDNAATRARQAMPETLALDGVTVRSEPTVVDFEPFLADLRRDLESLSRGLPGEFADLVMLERDCAKSMATRAEKLAETDPSAAPFFERLDPTRERPSFPPKMAEALASGQPDAVTEARRVLEIHRAALQAVARTHLFTRLQAIIIDRCEAAYTNISARFFTVKKVRTLDAPRSEILAIIHTWATAAWQHVLSLASSFAIHDEYAATGPGRPAPQDLPAFMRQEQTYIPDLNDGVRVNLAPLQIAGVLAAEVLPTKDLNKTLEDRARWRSDERRWCRGGRLPQPGWWPAGSET